MKLQINLYQKEFHPAFELYTGQHLVIISILCSLLIGIAVGVAHHYKAGAEAELAKSKTTLSREEKQVNELRSELEFRVEDPVLKAKLAAATQDVETQQRLVAQIQSLSGLQSKSFSKLFDALSSNNKPNLWLTSFTVNENDLTIKGEVSIPSALPNWISGLTNTKYFNGQEFNDAIVERNQSVLAFELSSLKADAELDDAPTKATAPKRRGGTSGGS
ncbi:MAG: hypothetical protein AAGJ37_11450 [Pseudomonadota bacterium]